MSVNIAPGGAVEAMKMENEILAPRAGTIATVLAAAGAAIQAGETIATFAA